MNELSLVDAAHTQVSDGLEPRLPLLMYWGRRGLSSFVLSLARATRESESLLSIARANELHPTFAAELGERLLAVDTFNASRGALTSSWRIPVLRRQLSVAIKQRRVSTVIDLMPHVWMPAILPSVRRSGARYVALAHDADVHPGDHRTRFAKWPIAYCLRHADRVVALSRTVAERLSSTGLVAEERLSVLFHPDLRFESAGRRLRRRGDGTIRLAFLGRIMPYKGLPLFIATVERLRAAGYPVLCGVFGEGPLGSDAARLHALGGEVVNRWLSEEEIADVLSRYDALVASHIEASQSGVVAAALGAGVPVIATPVGGLVEQVADGVTGIVADDVSADALFEAVQRLFAVPGLFEAIVSNIARHAGDRSMRRFANELLALASA